MDFTFTEDQLLFQSSTREFLTGEVTPDRIRAGWETPDGRDPALWQQLAELGLTAITVPEAFGGLGMSELDFVLLAQECGYVALPEPLVHSALVAVPLLRQLGGELASDWLPRIASGEARVVVGLEQNLLVEDAHVADLLLLQRGDALYALAPEQCELRRNESVDPSRRLYGVDIKSGTDPYLKTGSVPLFAAALDRGALGCAAQALGLAQRMVEMAVSYSSDRQQFGKPIGSFQAVKHLMANVAVRLEYARAPVHRAAYSLANAEAGAARAVSHAKLMACEAANLAAKNSIQVHGAMGYTWEVDLHIFMKRAWALANTWGDPAFHKARIADYLFSDDATLGAGATFSNP
ncbi:MAG: acyl-CoA dehydrogenase family protein [Halieaceae bacterium]|jgi:alkylation response protein AidB-like acyl-CoA dehydrogenase|nr:acyl-CoA dehydrogenase family protein [Halieaceae bacterium]